MSFFDKAIPVPTPEIVKWKSLLEAEEVPLVEAHETRDEMTYKYYWRTHAGTGLASCSSACTVTKSYLTSNNSWFIKEPE
jgi:hypothetical protein